MPIKVECPNPDCGASFNVKDELAGRRVKCPRCGSVVTVPVGEGELNLFDSSEGDAGQEQERRVPFHPARQQCPQCGAVLGVREKFCPKCGADIRTGVVRQSKAAHKRINWAPFIGIGAFLAVVAVLATIVVLIVKNWDSIAGATGAEEEVAERAEEAGAPEGPPIAPAGEAGQTVSKEELSALTEEEKRIEQAIEEFQEELKTFLQEAWDSSAEQKAAGWADLYSFCKDRGLEKEAMLCWHRAIGFSPRDSATNEVLGRTAQFMGEPVTPEQQRFLEQLMPRVEVRNLWRALQNLKVAAGSEELKSVPFGDSAQFRVETAFATVRATFDISGNAQEIAFEVQTPPGLWPTVELRRPDASPSIPFDELGVLYQGVRLWSRFQTEQGALDEAKAEQSGWTRESGGWKAPVGKNWSVSFKVDDSGKLVETMAGPLSLCGTSSEPAGITRAGATVTIHGMLSLESKEEGKKHVFYGSKAYPVGIRLDTKAGRANAVSGVYYVLKQELAPQLANILSTVDDELAVRRANAELEALEDEARLGVRALEAEGKLHGRWQAEWMVEQKMSKARRQMRQTLRCQDRAWEVARGLDRVAALSMQERERHLYLNWPRYRPALARVLQTSASTVLEKIESMLKPGADEAMQMMGMPGMAPPGMTPPGMEPPGMGMQQRRIEAQLLDSLVVFPADFAVERITAWWSILDEQAQQSAISVLQQIGTPEAVALLGSLSEQSAEEDILISVLGALGTIGTEGALRYLESPMLVPSLQAASLAARSLAGDPEALDSLPEFFAGANSSTRQVFLDLVTRADSPLALMVLSTLIEHYPDEQTRGRGGMGPGAMMPMAGSFMQREDWKKVVGDALIRMGGHTSMHLLGKLMERGLALDAEMLEKAAPEDITLLARPLGQMLRKGRKGRPRRPRRKGETESERIAILLGLNRSEAALKQLEAAAVGANRPEAVVGLAIFGSKQSLERAAAGCNQLDLDALKLIYRFWRREDAPEGQWAWRDEGIDPSAAADFLNAVLSGNGKTEVRVAAACMLGEMGRKLDGSALLALLSTLAAKPAPARTPGPGMPPGMMPPGGPGMPPMGPTGPTPAPATTQSSYPVLKTWFAPWKEPPSAFEFPGGAESYALGLFVRAAGQSAAAQLRDLAESAQDPETKASAIMALGRLGGWEDINFLRAKLTEKKESFEGRQDFQDCAITRAAAAVALGITADRRSASTLAAMLVETPPPKEAIKDTEAQKDYEKLAAWWQMTMQAAACQAFAEMCCDSELSELVDGDLSEELLSRFAALVVPPDSDVSGLSQTRTELRAAALRAFARGGGFSRRGQLVLLNRLAVEVGWGEAERPGGPGPMGPGMMPMPGPAMASPSPGHVAPLELKCAFIEALAEVADDPAVSSHLAALPAALSRDEQLKARWDDLAVKLARRDKGSCYRLICYGLNELSPPALRRVIEELEGKFVATEPDYYRLVAQIAARPLRAKARTRGGRRRSAMPSMGPMPAMPPGFGPPGAMVSPMAARTRATAEQIGDDDAGLLEWIEDARLRWRCLDMLAKGPAPVLSAVLQDESLGLLNHKEFGPAAARILKEASPGFDLFGFLETYCKSQRAESAARAAVLVARKVEEPAARDFLAQVLYGPQRWRATGSARPAATRRPGGAMPGMAPVRPELRARRPGIPQAPPGPTPPGMPGMPGMFRPVELPTDSAEAYAARALGSMGHFGVLAKAFEKEEQPMPGPMPGPTPGPMPGPMPGPAAMGEVEMAAMLGIACLPEGLDPIGKLKALKNRYNDAASQELIDMAIEEAYRYTLVKAKGAL